MLIKKLVGWSYGGRLRKAKKEESYNGLGLNKILWYELTQPLKGKKWIG